MEWDSRTSERNPQSNERAVYLRIANADEDEIGRLWRPKRVRDEVLESLIFDENPPVMLIFRP